MSETPESRWDEVFQAFARRIEKSSPGVDALEGPAGEEEVAKAEEDLDLTLPPSYRAFLLRWNGGSGFDTSLYGVGCADDGYDLAVLNLRGRREGLPSHLVGFASTGTGDVYCFDTTQANDDGECPVSLIDVHQGQVIPACDTFLEWLERLPDLEQELADRRGPQPMTIEEWEAFLSRERAKLRRLAQTPARELSMPDPEEVRADLAGKIPVDPRHLKPKGD